MAWVRGLVSAGKRALKSKWARRAMGVGAIEAARTQLRVMYEDINDSTAIQRIGFSNLTSELRIVFKNKPGYPEYVWGGVEPELFEAFVKSPSKGKFYHAYLKGRGEYRITPTMGTWKLSAIGRRISK